MKKDSKFLQVLADYDKRIQSEDNIMKSLPVVEGMKLRDEFLLAVGEDVAVFMNTLIKSVKTLTISVQFSSTCIGSKHGICNGPSAKPVLRKAGTLLNRKSLFRDPRLNSKPVL